MVPSHQTGTETEALIISRICQIKWDWAILLRELLT